MKKLLAIALLGLSVAFGYSGADSDKIQGDLIYTGIILYSPEIPVPICYDCYDIDKDGKEEVREVYEIEKNGQKRLIAKFIDRNKDSFYEDYERYFIVNLEEEFRQQKLKELLSKAKPFQRYDFI